MIDNKEIPSTVGARVAYIRVSTADQKSDRQRAELEAFGIQEWFEDTASGKSTDRPKFEEMMRYLRRGDVLFVSSMDRLARSLKDLLTTVEKLQEKEVGVYFVHENFKVGIYKGEGSIDPMGKLILSIMGAIAEFERALILERQREGIELAKIKGVYKGRTPISETVIDKAREKLGSGISAKRVAHDLGISYSTIYRKIIKKITKLLSRRFELIFFVINFGISNKWIIFIL